MNTQRSVQKQVLSQSSSALSPKMGDNVYVHYTGKLPDGTVFDSSYNRGTPFNFRLNAGQVIPGWDIAVASMKKGEKALFFIPSELAYGQRGAGSSIPPNADLFFEIELLDF